MAASPRIMVVEDEYVVAKDLQAVLTEMGYAVSCLVASGEEALTRAHADRPDLVLMDVFLAGELDGAETARRINQDLNIPVIFLTAYADHEIVQRAKASQPFGYLVKPLDFRELQAAIEVAAHKADMEAKLRQREEELRLVADYTYAWEMWITPQGGFRYVSPSCSRISGYDRQEFMDDPALFERIAHPDDRELVRRGCHKACDGAEAHEVEYRIINKAGDERWVKYVCQAALGDDGQWLGCRASCHDITPRRRAQAERERLIKELTRALSEVKTLSGLLPICANCKRIRNDEGYWDQVESYIQEHADVRFSHSLCPSCIERFYPELCITEE